MRFVDLRIVEGQGMRARKPGSVYVDRDGTEYEFQVWDFKFPNDADSYESTAQMLAAAEEQTKNNPQAEVRWINAAVDSRYKSFAFAKLTSKKDGKQLWLGKYFKAVNPTNTIRDTEVVKANLTPEQKGSASVKAVAGLQPGMLGLADGRQRSVGGIEKILAKHTNGDMLVTAIDNAVHDGEILFKDGASIITAIQDDFCEVLAPVAMMNKHSVVQGPLDSATQDIFKTTDVSDAMIAFPSGQNNPLIDAYIINKEGLKMGVSHKGKAGAKASISNIHQAKEQAAKTETGQAFINKYTQAVEILDICKAESAVLQPITLGLKFGIINESEGNTLKQMMSQPRDEKYKLIGDPDHPKIIVKDPRKEDLAKVPEEMVRLFKMGGYRAGSYVSFVCLARLAYLVADYINNSAEIDFGEAIRSFLNSSAMVQATTIAGKRGQDAFIRSIGIVYPPDFREKAKMSASSYYGTEVKNKFAFELPKT